MQPARRSGRARSRRLLAPRDHDRVGGVGHRRQGRAVDRPTRSRRACCTTSARCCCTGATRTRSRSRRSSPTVADQVAAELAAFGVTHADEGAAALDAWGFPEPFVEAVALHQHGVEEPKHALGRVLRVAEAVALEHSPMPGYPATPDIDRLLLADPAAARRLRLRHPRGRRPARAHRRPAGGRRVTDRDETYSRLDAIQARSLGAAAGGRARPRAARRAARGRVPARAREDRDDARRPASYLQHAVDVVAQMYPGARRVARRSRSPAATRSRCTRVRSTGDAAAGDRPLSARSHDGVTARRARRG